MQRIQAIDIESLARMEDIQEKEGEEYLGLHPAMGIGTKYHKARLARGLNVYVQDFQLRGTGPLRLEGIDQGLSSIMFYVCLSGIDRIHQPWAGPTFQACSCGVELSEYPCLFMDVSRNAPVRVVAVGLDSDALVRISGMDREGILEMFQRAGANLCRKSTPSRNRHWEMETRLAAGQLMRAMGGFAENRLYVESKALEILALRLRQLRVLSGWKSSGQRPPATDSDHVVHACSILRDEMADPPPARELARRVGMNHNRLVRAFRDRLGITPFSYLRSIRLNLAKELLAKGGCNVTEAAMRVGYGSLSHFTKAFRDEFGMPPKSWAKENLQESCAGRHK